MISGALISDCGTFRYKLWRIWDESLPMLVFVMLNPSTADASINDPTIVKCIGFAERNGYGGIMVVNLFAYRATKPADLKKVGWLAGPDNEVAILSEAAGADGSGGTVVCAWGAHARGLAAASETLALLRRLGIKPKALAFTDDGIPRHPLMLPYSCTLQEMPE